MKLKELTDVTYNVERTAQENMILSSFSSLFATAPSHLKQYTSLLFPPATLLLQQIETPLCLLSSQLFISLLPCPSFTIFFFFILFLFYTLQGQIFSATLEIIAVGWKLHYLQNVNKRKKNRCAFSLMTVQFLSLSLWFWKSFLSPRGWRILWTRRGACNPLIL